MPRLLLIPAILLLLTTCRRNVVDLTVSADFTYEVLDNDYSVPVRIAFQNTSKGAQFYRWTFEGGLPETYDKADPGYVTFEKPGLIKIKLEAWNDEEHKEKEITLQLDSVVQAGFTITPVINNYGPTDFTITNLSKGVTKYQWTFENGQPATSIEKEPQVRFNTPGEHRVFLTAQNDRGEKDTVSQTVIVLPALDTADFTIVPSFDDDDYEAPLTATLENHTVSATTHHWSAPGGVLSNAADSIPTVTFSSAGTYTITYEASNGKQTKTVTRQITVKPNTGLRTFKDVQLGINTAHTTIGSFFSTRLRQVFTKDAVNADNGPLIDLAFFGLSESFSVNLFVSPDSVQAWTFAAIPGATTTRRINSLEKCNCPAQLTPSDFDAITSGSQLQSMPISENASGLSPFNSDLLPRVVLFQNAAGKKGAVKIKQFVPAGKQSYIVCDIKVQKD